MKSSNKEIVVYWAPIWDLMEEPMDWNMLYYEPEQLYSAIQTDKVQQIGDAKLRDTLKKKNKVNVMPHHNLFRCPAVQNITKNTFVLRNPIETYIRIEDINYDIPPALSSERGLGCDNDRIRYLSPNWIACDIVHLSILIDCDLFVYGMRWIFFTEEDALNYQFSSPWFSNTPHLKYGSVIPGKFDCGKWFRSINPEFNLWPGTGEFRILEDEPIGYVQFETEHDVKLVRFQMNEALTKYSRTTAMSSSWHTNVPLIKRYKRFKETNMKKMILKEIKGNIV